MERPLISIIVPVFNMEQYLERCINSIRNQTYRNLEIILVDDGSTDRSGEICDAFSQKDSRIQVFHKENGGQSSARNLGLDRMTGEYVAFVDSDDWIEKEMYEKLYELIRIHDAQIACCGIQNDFPDGRTTYYNPAYPQNVAVCIYSKMEALRESLNNTQITYSPCDKLYHKGIFNDLRMTIGKIYEDMEIIPKCLERASTIVYDPAPMYHYTMTEQSTIRGAYNIRRFAEADIALEKAEDYRVRYPDLYDTALARYYAICLSIFHLSAGVKDCKERRALLIDDLRKPLNKKAVLLLPTNNRIKLFILRLSPYLLDWIWNVCDLLKRSI